MVDSGFLAGAFGMCEFSRMRVILGRTWAWQEFIKHGLRNQNYQQRHVFIRNHSARKRNHP